MKNLKVLDHPVLQHKLSILRDKNINSFTFRQVLGELSKLMAYEVTRDLKTVPIDIETPLEKTQGHKISDKLIVVPIFRAGLGMIDGILEALPFASVGHVGIYRDKVMNHTVEYYFKLPVSHKASRIFLIDPLLATGDTALACLERLKEYGVGRIDFLTLLAAESGVSKIQELHPDVNIYTVSMERELNEQGYLLPGIGDAGDRLFHTQNG